MHPATALLHSKTSPFLLGQHSRLGQTLRQILRQNHVPVRKAKAAPHEDRKGNGTIVGIQGPTELLERQATLFYAKTSNFAIPLILLYHQIRGVDERKREADQQQNSRYQYQIQRPMVRTAVRTLIRVVCEEYDVDAAKDIGLRSKNQKATDASTAVYYCRRLQ